MSAPILSAIIPTRDRPDLLRDALATLAQQDVASGVVEVIVIDDGSEPPLDTVVAAAAASAGPVEIRYARQQPSGLNVGRNHGARLARGDLLAYLDDDVLVDANWARAMIDAFESGAVAVAGRIELQLEGPEPRWLTAKLRLYLSELELGTKSRRLDAAAGELPVGANCAVTRAMFESIGGFAVGLDRHGTSLVSNGDTEFFMRVARTGAVIAYAADAHVFHRVPPARLTTEWFARRARAQGVSDALLEPELDRWRARRAMSREFARATRAIPILVRNLVDGRGPASAHIWLEYCRGRFHALRARPTGSLS